jgi:dCTP deaminase
MILSSIDILKSMDEKTLRISPFSEEQIRPASVIFHLGSKIKNPTDDSIVNVQDEQSYPVLGEEVIDGKDGYVLMPGSFILGSTIEKIGLSRSLAGTISTLTGLARLGMTAELSKFISPGFGEKLPLPLTLELVNFSNHPIRIFPGMRICHVIFYYLSTPASQGYDSSVGIHSLSSAPEGSKFFKYFNDK